PLIRWFWRGSQTSDRFSLGKVGLAKISFDFRHGHVQFQLRIFVQQLLLTTLRSNVRLALWQSRLLKPILKPCQATLAFSTEDHVRCGSLSHKGTATGSGNSEKKNLNHIFRPSDSVTDAIRP